MYSLGAYGAMIADSVRMEAYEEALRRVVGPDSIVLDIGAGAGIMSLLAAKVGARKVIAVEPNPLVRIGARLAAENGLADRITFVQGRSQQIEMGEKADVIVADLRGGLPSQPDFVDAVVDARRRLMKASGLLIPMRDTIFVAPGQAEDAHSKLVSDWRNNAFGFSMEGAVGAMLNQGTRRVKEVDRLLGGGQAIACIDYMKVESPSIDAKVTVSIETAGVVHGLSLWFETELVQGVGFSTAPNQKETVYGRVFLPISEPVTVRKGDRIEATIKAGFDDQQNIWIWQGKVLAREGSMRRSFASSSAFFNPESDDVREVVCPGCVPALTEDGKIMRELVLSMNGERSVDEIVSTMMLRYPGRFKMNEDALEFVRNVVVRYGETTLRLDD